MKQFTFTLQQWYAMQVGMEKQLKMEIGAVDAQIARFRDDLQALNNCFDKSKNEYCSAVSVGIKSLRANDYSQYFEHTKLKMNGVQAEINRLEREKEQLLQKLLRVRREIKLLDKLREKQYRAYLSEAKKQQDKFIDDMISHKVTVS